MSMTKDDNDEFKNPWDNNSGDKKKKPKKSISGGNKPPEPDFDEVIRQFKKNADNIFSNKGGGKGGDNKRGLAFLAAISLALYIVFGSIFVVATGEQAVILRFGKYDRTVGDGLNFKLPQPFERRIVVDVETIRPENIGQTTGESLMVTSDENIVDVKFTVQWKIGDLKDYVFKVRDAQFSVKSAAESSMREVIANTTIATALGEGAGRTKIAEQTKALLQEMLTTYGTGIVVTGIQLKPIDVPPQVVDAQIDVQNAKTEQQRMKNQAEAYRNDIIPRARGNAEKKIQEAEAYKKAVIAKSEGEASRFTAVYNEYRKAKDVTKKRIYLETMQEILDGMDKVIMDNKNGVLPYLPLPEIKKNKGGQQ